MTAQTASPLELPGGPLARRPLHFIFIADSSGSMGGAKINALNQAIDASLPAMRDVAHGNPNAEILVRALQFDSAARWHIAAPTPVAEVTWAPLAADGSTSMGRALQLCAEQLRTPPMPDRALPPVLVLLSDGAPTDDFRAGLNALMDEPWGKKAVRIAIAIGGDANLDVLQAFIGHPELKPLQANNAETLVQYIRWASTAVLQAASAPPSQARGSTSGLNVPLPLPPPPASAQDVW